MNLLLIPTIESVVALILLVIALAVGSLLTLNPNSVATGKAIRRRGCNVAATAVVFAWVGLMFAAIVGAVAGDRAAVAALWGSGPLGFVVGFMWPSTAPPADALPPRPKS